MILEVENLTKRFNSSNKSNTAVDNITFSLENGRCLGLIGESGSGKSTTANMVAGLLKPSNGKIIFKGIEINKLSKKKAREELKSMQMVFQSPKDSFNPRLRLLEAIEEPLLYKYKYNAAERRKKVEVVLEEVGLPLDYINKYTWEISGGECQRAAIARAIISEPDMLICDEVTSALDVSVQAQIINLLKNLINEKNLSMLFISHDLAVVSNICDMVAVMYKGSILEYGNTSKILLSPGHQYTKDLIQNAYKPGELFCDRMRSCDKQENVCKYYEFCVKADERCVDYIHNLLKIEEEHSVSCMKAEIDIREYIK